MRENLDNVLAKSYERFRDRELNETISCRYF